MQTAFAESILHVEHRVMGAVMQPFCAAHFAFLEAVQSPLAGDDPDAAIAADDFALAIKVCSIKPELYQGVWQIKASRISFTFLDYFRATRLASPVLRKKALRQWQAYYSDFCCTAQQMTAVGYNPAPVTAPGLLAAVVSALEYLPESRVWTMPINTLFSYSEIRSELKGAKIKFAPEEKELKKIKQDLDHANEVGKRLQAERVGKCPDY